MALTPAQLTTLKADILADPILSAQPNNSDGAFFIAAEYNKLAVPDFIVWRSDVLVSDVKKAIVWTEYIAAVSQADHNAFGLMISNGIVNAADPNSRQGFADIFSGPNKDQTLAALQVIAKRKATRAEKLFATGLGTNASPATMGFEGSLSFRDVEQARAL